MFGSNKRFSVTGSAIKSVPVASPGRQTTAKSQSAEIANMFGGGGVMNGNGNTSVNVYASGPLASTTLLNSLVPEYENYLRRYYHDIYYMDPVAGTAVDLMSSFPFSDYTLTGCDQKKLDKYAESLTRVNVRSLMPEISTAYLVNGSSINSFLFNKREKIFIDLIQYSVDNCTIQQIPFYSQDPSITVKNTQDMIDFMNSRDKNAEAFKRLLPRDLVATFSSQAFKLDPFTTLYLSRRTLPGAEPTSFLKRVLPIYILEKVLYRGTIVEANKRQRSMLHVAMGDDTHTFTPEEMAETVNQFQLADLDPLGAVIGTRNDVQASEIRQGGDFWKWTDTIEQLVPYKLRALGISEAFLSGDSNYSNCLVYDTLIPTSDGLRTIGSLGEGKKVNEAKPLDIKVMSRYKTEQTAHWLYNGIRDTLVINTETGNEIQGTKNHPVLVLSEGKLDWKLLGKLSIGDTMCVQTKALTRKTKLKLDVAPYVKLEVQEVNKNGDTRGLNPNSHKFTPVTLPKVMTPKLAYWLALFISEGFTGFRLKDKTPRIVGFGNSDKRLVNRFAALSAELFEVEIPQVKHISAKEINDNRSPDYEFKATKDFYTCNLPSFVLCDWLEKIGCSMRGKHNSEGLTPSYFKVVPWSVLQADEASQLAFLAAYSECDGSITNSTSVFSKSKDLCKQVQAMWNSHGYTPTRSHKQIGIVSLSREDSLDFWAKAGKYLSSKKAPVKGDQKYSKQDGVPADYWLNLIADAKLKSDKYGATYRLQDGSTFTNSRNSNKWGFATRDIKKFNYQYYKDGKYTEFLKFLKVLNLDAYKLLVQALKLEYRFSTVTSIEDGGKQPVYDISMANGVEPAFVANGLIVHNTETALSVFLENLDQYRSFLTYETFTNKLFPIVAIANDFFKAGKAMDKTSRTGMTYQVNNNSDLEIPTIHWHKNLAARDEDNVMDTLSALTEKGFPIPMRMWAAAGKIDLNAYIHDLEQDKQWRDRIAQAAGLDASKLGAAGDGMGDEGMSFAALSTRLGGGIQRQSLLSRDFSEAGEVIGATRTGMRRYIHNQAQANADANNSIRKALKALGDPNVKGAALARVKSKLGKVPNIIGVPGKATRSSPLRRV